MRVTEASSTPIGINLNTPFKMFRYSSEFGDFEVLLKSVLLLTSWDKISHEFEKLQPSVDGVLSQFSVGLSQWQKKICFCFFKFGIRFSVIWLYQISCDGEIFLFYNHLIGHKSLFRIDDNDSPLLSFDWWMSDIVYFLSFPPCLLSDYPIGSRVNAAGGQVVSTGDAVSGG